MPAYDANLFTPPAPVAKVILKNSDNGTILSDVPMLLDSGADVTLVPQKAINPLGITAVPNVGYELMGFNGTRSIVKAVHLDLVFFKRTFRGKFLLINQEYGIIGRDILNSISLLLDGPHLIWREEKLSKDKYDS